MKQLTIPQHQDVPERTLKLIKICNQADKYWHNKLKFYLFKNKFLEAHAHESGYDLQIIKRKCRNCQGSGKHWNNEPCWQCNPVASGYHHTDYVVLKRYLLNGELFHTPVETVKMFHESIQTVMNVTKVYEFSKVIHGLMQFEPYDYNPNMALYELYALYEPEQLKLEFINCGKHLRTRALHKWREICRRNKNMLDAFKEYLGMERKFEDDLPF